MIIITPYEGVPVPVVPIKPVVVVVSPQVRTKGDISVLKLTSGIKPDMLFRFIKRYK